MGAAFAWVARKVVAFGLGRAAIVAAGALASAALLWLWNDYQDAKARVVELRGQVEQAVVIQAETVALAQAREAQLRADLAAARATSQRRARETASLQADLDRVRQIQRPDDEKACPVHPAIGFALGRLRGAGTAGP